MAILVDSYSESNFNVNSGINSVNVSAVGQSFTGDGTYLSSAKLYLNTAGFLSDNYAYAKIYAHSGVYGTSSVPTGSPLATSLPFSVLSLTYENTLYDFTFVGVNKIKLENGTKYVLAINYDFDTFLNVVGVGGDSTSPTHSGNKCSYDGSWSAVSTTDLCFYVYSDIITGPFPTFLSG